MLKNKPDIILKFCVVLSLSSIFLLNVVTEVKADTLRRSYQYDSITTTIKINQDSTLDVEETQVFHYIGSYHKGFRSVSLNKADAITDISVIDGKNNEKLIRSNSTLTKEDPDSWGKYTDYKQNGNRIIEWYYDLSDTTYTWIIKYKVHGGIEFNRNLDRLYWNILTDYDVPIKQAKATIILPGDFNIEKLPAYSYRNFNKPVELKISIPDRSVSFTSSDFVPKEAFTIDISWPKGVVSHTAYWFDFIKIYWGYIASIVIFLVCLITGFIFWLLAERLKKGKGTIIPQYKPPANLKPAIAEVITKEKITSKGLAATIVDLAVRGYLKIEEEPQGKFWLKVKKITNIIFIFILVVFVLVVVDSIVNNKTSIGFLTWLFTRISFVLIIALVITSLSPVLFRISDLIKQNPDYIIIKLKSLDNDDIADYERRYLNIFLQGSDIFRTKSFKYYHDQELYKSIQKLKEDICKHASLDTKAYEVDLMEEKKKTKIWTVLLILITVFIGMNIGFNFALDQNFFPVASFIISTVGLYAFIKYEARLNKEGRILKEEWLGFKLYLEKAEKYRLQKLTPELFEKYLSYAMIFGIEKQWAKAFEGINIPSPSWYGGGYYGGSGNIGSSGSSFSASGFSASFASSFSSSFGGSATSGGGGGGGAGGGGGGGGGGAS